VHSCLVALNTTLHTIAQVNLSKKLCKLPVGTAVLSQRAIPKSSFEFPAPPVADNQTILCSNMLHKSFYLPITTENYFLLFLLQIINIIVAAIAPSIMAPIGPPACFWLVLQSASMPCAQSGSHVPSAWARQ